MVTKGSKQYGYMSQEDNVPDGHLFLETLAVSQSSVPSEETLWNLSCLKMNIPLTLHSSLTPRPTDHSVVWERDDQFSGN